VNRLGRFWRQRGGRGKSLLVVVAVVAVLAIVAVISVVKSSDEDANVASEAMETTETEGTTTRAPIRCLDDAGLSDVEERDVDLWRGFHDRPFYAVIVHKLARPAKAPIVVAGAYAVTGPFKVVAEGTGLTSGEGLEADALVQEVAACLGG
jgi:type II secretory pathway pseudopilin PulG